jgi:hypothetical protein
MGGHMAVVIMTFESEVTVERSSLVWSLARLFRGRFVCFKKCIEGGAGKEHRIFRLHRFQRSLAPQPIHPAGRKVFALFRFYRMDRTAVILQKDAGTIGLFLQGKAAAILPESRVQFDKGLIIHPFEAGEL